jgi:subtilase family serine protease
MRLSRMVCAAAGSCAVVLGGIGVAAPVISGSAAVSANVFIYPDIVTFHGPAAAAQQPTTAQCEQNFNVACYSASQIERAYGVRALFTNGIDGKGETIVLVDSFGSPTIAHDLKAFDAQNHIAAPPSLKIIQPAGKVPPYQQTSTREGWAGETTLDVEYSHAMAPGANILLVETPVAETEGVTGFPQIVKAENFVVAHHLGDVISQSFGATEESFPSAKALLALRSAYVAAAKKGITVLASTGDLGAANVQKNGSTFFLHPVTAWPATDPLVTAVGGTQLHLNASGARKAPDQVWNDTFNKAAQEFIFGSPGPSPLAAGGGVSAVFSRPSYQNGVASAVGSHRGVPDISMSAACDGAVNVFQSFPGTLPGWTQVCGTSEASPLFAGVVALADQVAGHPLGVINSRLYQLLAAHAPGLVDVTKGNNTVAFTQGGKLHTVHGFMAGPGYDLASGTGTVNAALFVNELAGK